MNDNSSETTRNYVQRLSIDGFKEAIHQGLGVDIGRELHLRINLLWAWHEAMEEEKMQPEEVYADPAYNENIVGLQKTIDTKQLGGELFLAELHRFAGNFEEAAAIFEKHLDNTDFDMVIESHRRCFEHDRRTYQMN